jgi:hypothetical protein
MPFQGRRRAGNGERAMPPAAAEGELAQGPGVHPDSCDQVSCAST